MPFELHHAAAKGGRLCRQAKGGLDEPQVRKHGTVELAIEICREIFGSPIWRKTSGNR
jgi:hypothetical protein